MLIQAVPRQDPSNPAVADTIDRLRADLPAGTKVGGAVAENHDLHETFEEAHELLFWALTATALGHALAAVYHHVFLKDATLARMLPGNKRVGPDGGLA